MHPDTAPAPETGQGGEGGQSPLLEASGSQGFRSASALDASPLLPAPEEGTNARERIRSELGQI